MASFIKKNRRMTLQETDDFVLLVGESISVSMGAILSNLELELLMFWARGFESFAQVSVNASLH